MNHEAPVFLQVPTSTVFSLVQSNKAQIKINSSLGVINPLRRLSVAPTSDETDLFSRSSNVFYRYPSRSKLLDLSTVDLFTKLVKLI